MYNTIQNRPENRFKEKFKILEQTELDIFFDLVERLESRVKSSEKGIIGVILTGFLRSKSVSIRRSAKYELLDHYVPPNIPKRFSLWGPPEESEIKFWERRFRNYFNSCPDQYNNINSNYKF